MFHIFIPRHIINGYQYRISADPQQYFGGKKKTMMRPDEKENLVR